MSHTPASIDFRTLAVLLITGLFIAIAGCTSLRVRTDYDPLLDFSQFRSFSWLEPPVLTTPESGATDVAVNPFALNSMLDARIRAAVDQELESQGYRPASEGSVPSFQLQYHVILKDKTRLFSTPGPFYGGGYWGPAPYGSYGPYGAYGGTFQSYDYQQGTLVLDMVDPETKRIAWRGWAVGPSRDGYYDEERVRKAVRAILGQFPPEVASASAIAGSVD